MRVDGRLAFNSASPIVVAALAGVGIGYLPEAVVRAQVAAGRLVRVLEDGCPPFPGYHLY